MFSVYMFMYRIVFNDSGVITFSYNLRRREELVKLLQLVCNPFVVLIQKYD